MAEWDPGTWIAGQPGSPTYEDFQRGWVSGYEGRGVGSPDAPASDYRPGGRYYTSTNPTPSGGSGGGGDGGGGGSGGGSNWDPGRVPAGVPEDWAKDFIGSNPNDYHRLLEAYQSNNFGQQGGPNYPGAANWNTFSDPLTKQYEGLLQAQLAMYQAQQAEMQRAAEEAKARRAQTAAAVDRLTKYMNERVGKLQGPAYTGTEAEVLRTQFLDPLERDRSAAQKRALERISSRGFELDSGVAQELLDLVDREFNQYRTQGEGAIATRQIQEQRSREQEAQGLLQYLAMLPDAVARGDLDFVAYVQSLISQPGQQGIAIGDILAELPTRRLNDSLAVLGLSPNLAGSQSSAMQLLQLLQNNRYMNQQGAAGAWSNIGQSFMP